MFTWNFAKSAEAMFSRWAVKRVCKFVLKKKLGQFLLGEIDIDQLDVQLSEGLIHLHDLALNVEFLNEKLGAVAPVVLKEGSIGSLSVRMPWKGRGCVVQVDELELVIGPGRGASSSSVAETLHSGEEQGNPCDSGNRDHDSTDEGSNSASGNIHEGVKTVAKMVKWFLTSFNIKFNKLIIAFDPCLENNGDSSELHRTLVLRVSEIECGTCVSDDVNPNSEAKGENFLGIGRLTNFIQFQGAALELLQFSDDDDKENDDKTSVTTSVITGEGGGFSGNLKFSIPWKNGSLDIRKVDSDIFIDPLEVQFQPNTIKWLVQAMEVFKHLKRSAEMLRKGTDPGHLNSANSTVVAATHSGSSDKFSSLTVQNSCSETRVYGPNLISDWVPSSAGKKAMGIEDELDFGASVDQFFECLDGMRSSQSALGNSGMWNWTCSVFSAITAASSLASGSLYIPSEQQHVETNLNANFAGVSIFLFFEDKDHINAGSYVPYLGVECCDILLHVQVCPQEMRYEGTIKSLEISHFLSYKGDVNEEINKEINGRNLYTRQLQEDVQAILPPVTPSAEGSHELADFVARKKHNVVKVILIKTSGVTRWQLSMKSSSCDGGSKAKSSTSFEVELPQLVFWVDFSVMMMVCDTLKVVAKPIDEQDRFLYDGNSDNGENSSLTNLSTTKNMQGSIVISSARVFLCFPFKSCVGVRSFVSWDQFIALDFQRNVGIAPETHPNFYAKPKNMDSSTGTLSLDLKFSNLDILLINPASNLAENILTVASSSDCPSVISILFQDGNVTGPWIANKAKSIATCEESKSTCNFVRKDYEFASVSTVNDVEDSNSQTRSEMILSSTIFLHISLSDTKVKLGTHQYKAVQSLIDQIINGLSTDEYVKGSSSSSQTSVLVDCRTLEIAITPDLKENISESVQIELPGSWNGLKLQVWKFTLLSVSNIGGKSGANFFWLAHSEGKLWGSITSVIDEELLLISCNDSAMKRGDGGGSNALSSRLSGCDVVHMWDPESFHDFTSITLRCGTIIAIGGRLDWLDVILSFFSGAPSETEKEDNVSIQMEGKKTSFILNFVDIGLSYEPCAKNVGIKNEVLGSNANQETGQEAVACLLAASFLKLSNSSLGDSTEREFKIRVQDLGLHICEVSRPDNVYGASNARCHHKTGYVKVAQEALIEAILRTNCESGLLWEMECSKSHIYIETCHDTTSCLIRLASQLQQLFAPDMEESLVHLQQRWNRFQQEQEDEGVNYENSLCTSETDSSPSNFEILSSIQQPGFGGLMDEICEDAFQMDKIEIGQYDSPESPQVILDSQDNSFPELIELYCFPEINPFTETSVNRQSLHEDTREGINGINFENVSSGWYRDTSLNIVEDHISRAGSECDVQNFEEIRVPSIENAEASSFRKPTGHVLLKNIDVRWRMYGGSDWQDSTETDQRGKHNRGRDTNGCVELTLCGIEFQYEAFPAGSVHVSKLALSVENFHLYDLRRDAPWKLVLGYYESKDHPRKSSSKAFKLDLEAVRPDPLIPLEEYRLRVAFLPMRLHLHQSQLDFLIGFFGGKGSSFNQPQGGNQDPDTSNLTPVKLNAMEDIVVEEALLPYFQSFEIWPILVRIDYSPSRVDLAALRGGKYVELVNLVPWKGVELKLKHVNGVGVYGWVNVCETAGGEWLEDISQNQVRKILQGLPPIRSVVALGAGAAKLVSLPVKSYRKDKRVLKGMQRGISAFIRSISVEAVGLGVHLAAGAHDILLQAEYMVSNTSPSVPRQILGNVQTGVRYNQPRDAQEGIQQACESLSSGLGRSASALVQQPWKKYLRGGGAGSAMAAAVRAVPTAAIAPASACAGAVHYTFLGFRNSLDPERKKESMEKYMGPCQPWEQK